MRHNPDWDYHLWTDDEIRDFVFDEFPEFFPVWCSYPKHIMRVDAWRYLLLKRRGGLYVDLDIAALRPLDPWIGRFQQFACADQGDGNLCNALMWAPEAEAPFLDEIVEAMTATAYHRNPLLATGPWFLQWYASSRIDQVSQIPTGEVYPITVWNREPIPEARNAPLDLLSRRFEDAVAISFWTGSWTSQSDTIIEEPGGKTTIRGLQLEAEQFYFAVIPESDNPRLLDAHREVHTSNKGPLFRYWPAESVASVDDGADLRAMMKDFLGSGKSWAFLCTEATYVVPTRIGTLLDNDSQLVCNENLMAGGRFQRRAGYVIARRLAEKVVAAGTVHTEEDLARFVSDQKIPVDLTPLLRHDRFRYPTPENTLVSTAFDDPGYFQIIPHLLEAEKITTIRCAHQHWTGDLQFSSAGGCMRPATGCCGTWKFLHGGHRLIDWLEWPQEVMFSIGEDLGFVVHAEQAAPVLEQLPPTNAGTFKREKTS